MSPGTPPKRVIADVDSIMKWKSTTLSSLQQKSNVARSPVLQLMWGNLRVLSTKKFKLYLILMDWNKSFNIIKNAFNNTPPSVYLFFVALWVVWPSRMVIFSTVPLSTASEGGAYWLVWHLFQKQDDTVKIWLLKIAEMQHQSGYVSVKTDCYGQDEKERKWFLPYCGLSGAETLFSCKEADNETDLNSWCW